MPSATIIAPMFARERNVTPSVSFHAYLSRLMTVAVPPRQLMDYVRTLKEFTGRRLMAVMADEMAQVAKSASSSILSFNERVVEAIDGITASLRNQGNPRSSPGRMTKDFVARLAKGEKPNLVDTGLLTLNREVGGWARGELNILAGRTSMGKTTVATSLMRQAARHGVTAIFFSMEMSGDPVSARMLSDAVYNSQSPIAYKDMLQGRLQSWDIERMQSAQANLAALPVQVDRQAGLTAAEMRVRAQRFQDELERQGKRLDAIWVGRLGFMRSSDRYGGNMVHETGEKTKSLKALAKSLDVPVIALCQLNRGVEQRAEDKRPMLADLRDSGNIEEGAATVWFALRAAYYLARKKDNNEDREAKRKELLAEMENILELIGAKNRNGNVFNRQVFAHMASNAVRDLAAEHEGAR